jgi:tRNA(Ile)-lysidine synthase TilS/MesJ
MLRYWKLKKMKEIIKLDVVSTGSEMDISVQSFFANHFTGFGVVATSLTH